jgi:hypothetical protein
MRAFGFSTGALAPGDFRRGLDLLRGSTAQAVELSALREHELPALMQALDALDLAAFPYVSVHAPSRLVAKTEKEVAALLRPCLERAYPVVVHPDAIVDPGCWRDFGRLLCIENMDKRKPTGRTAAELGRFFAALPDASLCLDLAHAREVDPSLSAARSLLAEWGGDRLAQLHLSDLDAESRHLPLTEATVDALRALAQSLPPVPVLLESPVGPDQLEPELAQARRCFERSPAA